MTFAPNYAFDNENNLRRWFREHCFEDDKVFFIEPSHASTTGLPDCFVVIEGRVVWIEFKMLISKLIETYPLRPSQAKTIGSLVKRGVDVFVLYGIKGTGELCSLYFNDGSTTRIDATEGDVLREYLREKIRKVHSVF